MTTPNHSEQDDRDWDETAAELRDNLRTFMADRCILRGDFQLSSGAASSVYFDCKRATLEGLFLCDLADWVMGEVLPALPARPDLAGGPTLGADSIAAAIAMRASRMRVDLMAEIMATPDKEIRAELPPGMSVAEYREGLLKNNLGLPLEAAIVRKERKAHGTRTMIENDPEPGSRVLVVEDVITTGASIARACDAFIEAECELVGIFALLDREAGGREALEKKYGVPVLPLFKLSDFPEVNSESPEESS